MGRSLFMDDSWLQTRFDDQRKARQQAEGDAVSERLRKIEELEKEHAAASEERTLKAEAAMGRATGEQPGASARSGLGGGQQRVFGNPLLATPETGPDLGQTAPGGSTSSESDGFQRTRQNTVAPGTGMQILNDARRQTPGSGVATWKDQNGQERVMSITPTPKYQQEAGMSPEQMRAGRAGMDEQAAAREQMNFDAQAKQNLEIAKSQSKVVEKLYGDLDKYSSMASGFVQNPITGATEKITDPDMIAFANNRVRDITNSIRSIIANTGGQGGKGGEGGEKGKSGVASWIAEAAGIGGAAPPGAAPPLSPAYAQGGNADLDEKDAKAKAALADPGGVSQWPGDPVAPGQAPEGPSLPRTQAWLRQNMGNRDVRDSSYMDPTAPVTAQTPTVQGTPGAAPFADMRAMLPGPIAEAPQTIAKRDLSGGPPSPRDISNMPQLADWITQRKASGYNNENMGKAPAGATAAPSSPEEASTPEELSAWVKQRVAQGFSGGDQPANEIRQQITNDPGYRVERDDEGRRTIRKQITEQPDETEGGKTVRQPIVDQQYRIEYDNEGRRVIRKPMPKRSDQPEDWVWKRITDNRKKKR